MKFSAHKNRFTFAILSERPCIYGNKTNTNINNLKIDLDHFKGLETNTANTLQRNKKRLLNDTQIA